MDHKSKIRDSIMIFQPKKIHGLEISQISIPTHLNQKQYELWKLELYDGLPWCLDGLSFLYSSSLSPLLPLFFSPVALHSPYRWWLELGRDVESGKCRDLLLLSWDLVLNWPHPLSYFISSGQCMSKVATMHINRPSLLFINWVKTFSYSKFSPPTQTHI